MEPPSNAAPFQSTGPAGHRGRMRERIIAHGGDALADYEILEMLLFLGLPRGDTKPIAKGLINAFGSLGGVLSADPDELAGRGGLERHALLPIRLVETTTERLTRREAVTRPLLGGVALVDAYLRESWDGGAPATRVLFLDNRNRLLGDEPHALERAGDAGVLRAVLRRALGLHATALIVADLSPHLASPEPGRAVVASRLREAGALLSVTLHDRMLLDPEGLRSYRAEGLLGA